MREHVAMLQRRYQRLCRECGGLIPESTWSSVTLCPRCVLHTVFPSWREGRRK